MCNFVHRCPLIVHWTRSLWQQGPKQPWVLKLLANRAFLHPAGGEKELSRAGRGRTMKLGGSGGESLEKLWLCRNQQEKKRKAVVSFHTSILIRDVDEDTCILIFSGRPSVCHEAKQSIYPWSHWTSLSPVSLLITPRFGGAPHFSWSVCHHTKDLLAAPMVKETWDHGPSGGQAGGGQWPAGLQWGNGFNYLDDMREESFTFAHFNLTGL